MDNKEKIKVIKRKKRKCLLRYYYTKSLIFSYALCGSFLLSEIIAMLIGKDPLSYEGSKNAFETEYVDNLGRTELYPSINPYQAIDELEINVCSGWIKEDDHYYRNRYAYKVEATDEFKNKVKSNINNVTEEDIKNIKFDKVLEYQDIANDLAPEELEHGSVIYIMTTHLGEKYVYQQTFEDNLSDVALISVLYVALFSLLKRICRESEEDNLELYADEYEYLSNEIGSIIRKRQN